MNEIKINRNKFEDKTISFNIDDTIKNLEVERWFI